MKFNEMTLYTNKYLRSLPSVEGRKLDDRFQVLKEPLCAKYIHHHLDPSGIGAQIRIDTRSPAFLVSEAS